MEMEFVTWAGLATYGGALAMVMLIVQFTKGIIIFDRLPTQLWSYIVALVVLYAANFFTGQLTAENAVLILFNAAIVALAANGGYSAIKKVATSGVTGEAMGTHADESWMYDDADDGVISADEVKEDAPGD